MSKAILEITFKPDEAFLPRLLWQIDTPFNSDKNGSIFKMLFPRKYFGKSHTVQRGGFKNCVYPECHGPRVLCVCTTLFCYHTVRPLKRVPFNRSQLKWTQLAGHTIYILRRPASSPGPANCVRGAGSGRSVPCMMLAPVTNFHEFFGQIDFVLSLVCDCQWAH